MCLAIGCDDRSSEVQFYPAPKEVPRVEPVVDTHGHDHGATESNGSTTLTWIVPAGWKELPAQQMRVATFAINEGEPPVELTVIPLGPEAGDVLANVNRWEGQLGLPASSKDALGEVVQHVDVNTLHVDVVDLTGAESQNPRQRMLAAIVPHGGKTWFFKAVGPVDIVSAQKANFDAFIASLKPDVSDGAAKTQAADGAATTPARPAVTATLAKHATPEGWTQQANTQAPRIVAFDVGPADKKAEMVVTSFAPDNAGGFRDNINRWRGQIGLEPITDPSSLKMEDATVGKDFPAIVLDFENPVEPAKRMVVAIASVGREFWFLKLTGPADVVAQQRNAFDAFIKSLEFTLAPAGNAPATQPQPSP